MQRLANRRLFFFGGLIIIAILYSFYNLYLLDERFFEITSRKTRHMVKFGSVLVVYGIGFFSFKRYSPAWLMQIWNTLYAGGLLLLVLLGIYDQGITAFSQPFRNLIVTFHEFLISPVPYVIMGIIGNAR